MDAATVSSVNHSANVINVNMTPFWVGLLLLAGLVLGAFLASPKAPWSKWTSEERHFIEGVLCGLVVGLLLLAPGMGVFAAFFFGFFFGLVGELTGAFRFLKGAWDLFTTPEWKEKTQKT